MFWGTPLSRTEATAPAGMESRPRWWQPCPGHTPGRPGPHLPRMGPPALAPRIRALTAPPWPQTRGRGSDLTGQGKRQGREESHKIHLPQPRRWIRNGAPANSDHLNSMETQIKWDSANHTNEAAASWSPMVGKSGLRETKRKREDKFNGLTSPGELKTLYLNKRAGMKLGNLYPLLFQTISHMARGRSWHLFLL